MVTEAYEQKLITMAQAPVLAKLLAGEEVNPYSEEELAAREARRLQREEAAARRNRARELFRAALAEITDPTARAVLDLHSELPGMAGWSDCEGCDFAGYDGDAPDWPCRTVRLIADRFHIKEEGE
jgi:hypothetical protein